MTRAIFMGATCSHACPSARRGVSFLFPSRRRARAGGQT